MDGRTLFDGGLPADVEEGRALRDVVCLSLGNAVEIRLSQSWGRSGLSSCCKRSPWLVSGRSPSGDIEGRWRVGGLSPYLDGRRSPWDDVAGRARRPVAGRWVEP